MPNQPRTQHRSVRISDEDWADLEAATAVVGSDRSTIIKQFIRWYLHRPTADLPERPDVGAWIAREVQGNRDAE